MYQGFYDLASGIITQRRNLNSISNNMVNLQTAGYKKDTMVSSSFSEEMLIRTGKFNKENPQELAVTSKIKSASRSYTDYEQGSFELTDGIYDFAISGRGFFAVRTEGNEILYTRNGSFSADAEGYLSLAGTGRVLGEDGEPIRLSSDSFTAEEDGSIYEEILTVEETEEGESVERERRLAGKLQIRDFPDYNELHKEDNGMFSSPAAGQAAPEDSTVLWKTLEKSNVNMVSEMTSMMSSQRALQSAAQMLRMYDTVMGKASSEVGRL